MRSLRLTLVQQTQEQMEQWTISNVVCLLPALGTVH